MAPIRGITCSRDNRQAAERMPGLRIPPPKAFLKCVAFSMKGSEPTITEPTGVERPLEKHRETESNSEQYSFRVISSAITAFHRRAPRYLAHYLERKYHPDEV